VTRVDVCIVGGGIAGASVLYHLSGATTVALVEGEAHAGVHSTGRSAAMHMRMYGGEVIRALTVGSESFFGAPPAGFTDVPLLRPRGALVIAREDQLGLFATEWKPSSVGREQLQSLSPQEARSLVDILRHDYVAGAMLDPTASEIDVEAMLQGYLRGARRTGARLLMHCPVRSIERRKTGWHLRAGEEEIDARILVNAAGAWADVIAVRAGVRPLGLTPCKRTAFTFDVAGEVDVSRWPVVMDAAEEFYFKPEAGRLLGSLCEETPGEPADVVAEDIDVAVAVDRIEAAIQPAVRRVVRAWAGQRVFAADRVPVSGFDDDVAGFYWHAGLGGYGIQTSAALGAFAARTILGQSELSAAGVQPSQLSPVRLRTLQA
jgi:D-arginine dehydrogenase